MKLHNDIYSLDALSLAPLLLGKLICRNINGEIIKARITETESYFGTEDTACHAHKGDLLHRSGQQVTHLLDGSKAVRQGREIRIDGHWLLLITMMKQASAQRQQHQRRKDARQHAG